MFDVSFPRPPIENIPILDHGYIRLVDRWGCDEAIIEAARMSTNKGFQGWGPREDGKPGDEKLLKYLWDNQHSTPFEMAGMTIEVQAPIMVFREWHRHRSQSYSELSARYSPLPNVDYLPTPERCLIVDAKNKQAGVAADAQQLTHETALDWLAKLADLYAHSEQVYQQGLATGVPKELARLAVTVGRYSRMRASANLRNWLAFLTLRSDCTIEGKKAQYEIRQYANALADLVAVCFPRTHALFVERK